MHLYRTDLGPVVFNGEHWCRIDLDWDELLNDANLFQSLSKRVAVEPSPDAAIAAAAEDPLPPIVSQEVWAAGVTYQRSKAARIDESQYSGGGDFYDRVYSAARPEIFFKASAHRTVGPNQKMHLRGDSKWIVPEPELTLVITRCGTIVGYTIGNDLSCRDIEGENPLYLPQAKTFDRCAAIGPAIYVSSQPLAPSTEIQLLIRRDGNVIVQDETRLSQMKRPLDELVDYLFRDNSHPRGCFLMTGTGIVPADDFCLRSGDQVEISIAPIGTLVNVME